MATFIVAARETETVPRLFKVSDSTAQNTAKLRKRVLKLYRSNYVFVDIVTVEPDCGCVAGLCECNWDQDDQRECVR